MRGQPPPSYSRGRTLVRGYRLTGAETFLNRAPRYWDRGSRPIQGRLNCRRSSATAAVRALRECALQLLRSPSGLLQRWWRAQFVGLLFCLRTRRGWTCLRRLAAAGGGAPGPGGAPLPTILRHRPGELRGGGLLPARVVAQASARRARAASAQPGKQSVARSSTRRRAPCISPSSRGRESVRLPAGTRHVTDGSPIFRSYSHGLRGHGDEGALSFQVGARGGRIPATTWTSIPFESRRVDHALRARSAPDEPGAPATTHPPGPGEGVATRGISPRDDPGLSTPTGRHALASPGPEAVHFRRRRGAWSFHDVARRQHADSSSSEDRDEWPHLGQHRRHGPADPAHEAHGDPVHCRATRPTVPAAASTTGLTSKHVTIWALYAAAFPPSTGTRSQTKYVSTRRPVPSTARSPSSPARTGGAGRRGSQATGG